jgi:dTDP-4-dehydrorhamnose reductase
MAVSASNSIKILVTGSNGLLGQKLTEQILQQPQWQLIATAIGPDRNPIAGDYTYVTLDITDETAVMEVLDKYRPNVVIHTAAMTNVDACEKDPEGCQKLNVEAVKYIVRACELHQTHLIHLSTDFIFDGKEGPYTEEALPNPLSLYGHSKWEAEKIVSAANCPWSIVRTVLVYGVVADMSRSNIVLWAKGALEKGQKLTVVNDQWRTPTLAEDLAQGCLLIAAQKATGIYNISGMDMLRIDELVRKVATHWNLDVSLVGEISSDTLNQAAPRPPRTGFVLDKAIRELGYQPHRFEDGLQIVDEQLRKYQS